ncbi:hypothetical protein RchiOBHm_Chr5g0080841 [Rosa chinensis]|uniref:Uncharacterized protein n=1 Tax=Rosa chinensis TaxID=74649 RepID=A0A2P6QMV4_ROSCH|nr:hypothetical protein RchiOBHm_Chr5g0080841 [Rosa chinensis]
MFKEIAPFSWRHSVLLSCLSFFTPQKQAGSENERVLRERERERERERVSVYSSDSG